MSREIKQNSYVALGNRIADLKKVQEHLLNGLPKSEYPTINEIPKAEVDLKNTGIIIASLKEARMPLTRALDDLKKRMMAAEETAAQTQSDIKDQLLSLKKELAAQEAAAKAKLDAELKAKQEKEAAELAQMGDIATQYKDLIDKAVNAWPVEGFLDVESYISAVERRINKLPGNEEDHFDMVDIFRHALTAKIEGLDAGKVTDAILEVVEEKKEEKLIEHLQAGEVDIKLVDTKALKHTYELDMPDDAETAKAIVATWLQHFDKVSGALRNRSHMTVNLGQVAAALAKLREDYEFDRLTFKIVDKL